MENIEEKQYRALSIAILDTLLNEDCREWLYNGKIFANSNAMSDYLFEEIYIERLGNSPDFECEPVLVDGVWYWEAW